MKTCSIEGCGGKFVAKDLCRKHWQQEWVLRNRKKAREIDRRWKSANIDKIRRSDAERRANNIAIFKARERAYDVGHRTQRANARRLRAQQFPEKEATRVAARTAVKLKATPKWANEFFIGEAYHLSRLRTKTTGFRWHVDHIVPLRSKIVCGLHWEVNLQVIPAVVNLAKRNYIWPDMP